MSAPGIVQEPPRTPVPGLSAAPLCAPDPGQRTPDGEGSPLPLLGLCFGTALLLGLLCRSRREGEGQSALRARQWEARAQRLMAIARAQEEELTRLRGGARPPLSLI